MPNQNGRGRVLEEAVINSQRRLEQRIQRSRLLGPLLGAFGLVSLFYGFEKLIDTTFLVDQPGLLVVLGAVLLLLTGSYYSKL